jgi:energy-coupling factor transporter ATP-binding protein EcfA2
VPSWHNPDVVALRDKGHVADALDRLAGALETLDLGPDLGDLASDRDRLAAQIRSYLIPRAIDADHPITVVFAGPTGSGKSTLINSLTGLEMSATGVLRPTTTGPVALSSMANAERHASIGGVPCEVAIGSAPVLTSMVLVDTPDIDSTSLTHREMAEILIDNADVVVFVTSALRYADAVPWQVLRRAVARGATIIHVLNRVGSATSGAVIDFRSRLAAAGLDDALITVPEHHLAVGAQKVPSIAVRGLKRRLVGVTGERAGQANATFERVLRAIVAQVMGLARVVGELAEDREGLEAELSLYLADRVGNLVLDDVGEGLYLPVPAGRSRGASRRWRRSNAVKPATVMRREQKVVDRIEAIVHGDLRRWMAEESELGIVDPKMVITETTPAARSAGEGWVQYVRRMAEEIDVERRWLTEAVLIAAATNEGSTAAAMELWSDDAPVLVDRAHRELVGRLDVVYQHAGALVSEQLYDRSGSLDDSDLRAALGAVTATLAPLHA